MWKICEQSSLQKAVTRKDQVWHGEHRELIRKKTESQNAEEKCMGR